MIAVRTEDADTLTLEGKTCSPEQFNPPAEKEDEETIRKRARKPPKEGLCKRCGEFKPINRLMLCYPCWIKVELEKTGWREGQAHPAGCGCDVWCKNEGKGAGN